MLKEEKMKIKLQVNPLSVNKAWRGRHFKTPEYKSFERDVAIMLPFDTSKHSKEEIFVHYIYYIKNYSLADTANMEKTLTDMLVNRGYISDDRYIRAIYQRKEKTDGPEYIEIIIEAYTGQDVPF